MACAGSRRGVSGGKIDEVVVAWRVEMARGRQRNEARAARTTRAIEPRADASRARLRAGDSDHATAVARSVEGDSPSQG